MDADNAENASKIVDVANGNNYFDYSKLTTLYETVFGNDNGTISGLEKVVNAQLANRLNPFFLGSDNNITSLAKLVEQFSATNVKLEELAGKDVNLENLLKAILSANYGGNKDITYRVKMADLAEKDKNSKEIHNNYYKIANNQAPNSAKLITISTADPQKTDGNIGDIWITYKAPTA